MTKYVPLRLVPVSLAEARRFIAERHRHNDPPVGHRASVGVADDTGTLRGVGVLGRPIARAQDDGKTAEIVRVATDGVPNGCSMLYGALVRVLTYTLEEESGSSLRAAGWRPEATIDFSPWGTSRVRSENKLTLFHEAKMPTGKKVRWVIERHQRRNAA